MDSSKTKFVKYHVQSLFTGLASDALDACLERLRRQPRMYKQASQLDRKKMQCRALFLSTFTFNSTIILTAKALRTGKFRMTSQRQFFGTRWRQSPDKWGKKPKSCFSRALCGYSIGADAVCVDRHLERVGDIPVDAPDQWRKWFEVYETMYGAGEAGACILWHIDALDWIALKRARPKAWK